MAQSEWISILSNEFGFVIHHANPPSVIVMLKWISESETYQVYIFSIHLIYLDSVYFYFYIFANILANRYPIMHIILLE